MSADAAALKSALADLLARVDERCNGKAEGNSPLITACDRARDLLAGTRREFFVVITERDVSDDYFERHPEARESNPDLGGPIVFEAYLDKATREHAEAHARKLGNVYGWVRVARLIVEDWPT